ncbi:neutral ceramidase-like [Bombyx mandarina]|uniref:Neutral ceramidase n=1 Tax=Bombyx mandarina TaxID=7092 RepID=A0A6J2JMF1_BOMMA|nr:neutral ceramidase-like [Bombyx mandarina]
MALSFVGNVVITVIVLGVISGTSATFSLKNKDNTDDHEDEQAKQFPRSEPEADSSYEVGVGIADMTGPCVEITFMGYAELGQSGEGIHLRQFSRAFIFSKGNTRVVLVTAEVQAVGIAVRRQVVKNLQERYGDMYSLRNVIITGTHTHSTPGGYLVDFILDVSILGFSKETFNAYVDGITRSIVRAHENMVPARLVFAQTKVKNAHKNRSRYSYNNNPAEERARYETNTDDLLTQVRIEKADGSLHGVMNWFSVHTTSMNMTNKLVSSDNLGYAALRMEKELNPSNLPGKPDIVAGFFSSSLGDVSPNTRGARCEFSNEECDHQFLLCAAQERCFSKGPGEDMFESTRIIGTKVFEGAMEALRSPGEELRGDLAVVHQFVEMSQEVVPKYDPIKKTFNTNEPVRGCFPALGYSFASGTIDGANTLNITQGTLQGNPLLDIVGGIVARPTADDVECHAPKPILLATGRANFPIPWHPHIISLSLIWLGDLAIVGVPGEPTTMSGRRMKAVVGDVMQRRGFKPRVVISGLTNEYIHYVTTYEEYQVQRYEAASTIYGPNTLDIMLNKFSEFTVAAIEKGDVPPGREPADNRAHTLSLILPVIADNPPVRRRFGDVIAQPPAVVPRGTTVTATFVGANPRNDLKQEESHAVVQRLELGRWIDVANDADWDTRFYWKRLSTIAGTSEVRFSWRVPETAQSAPHRVEYRGAARSLFGRITHFTAQTDSFSIQ